MEKVQIPVHWNQMIFCGIIIAESFERSENYAVC